MFHIKQISYLAGGGLLQPDFPYNIIGQTSSIRIIFSPIELCFSLPSHKHLLFPPCCFHTNTLSNTNFSWTLFTLLEVAPLLSGYENHHPRNPNHEFNNQTNVSTNNRISPSGSNCASQHFSHCQENSLRKSQAQLLTHLSLFAPPRSRRG